MRVVGIPPPTPPRDSPPIPSLSNHIYQNLAQTSEPTEQVPSPPSVWVPPPTLHGATAPVIVSLRDPTLAWAVASLASLTIPEYLLITDNNKPQQCTQDTKEWSYAERHKAHAVLDFLALGPASVVRSSPTFFADAGITMVLAVRDSRFPKAFQGALDTARNSGVAAASVVMDQSEAGFGLLRLHIEFARLINRHMLVVAEHSPGKRGRVLVVCETGNDRSVLLVGSYIMALYALGVVDAVPFLQTQRFCANITDTYRYALQTLEDMLRARLDVVVQRGPEGAVADGMKKRGAEEAEIDGPEVRPGYAPYEDYDEELME